MFLAFCLFVWGGVTSCFFFPLRESWGDIKLGQYRVGKEEFGGGKTHGQNTLNENIFDKQY